MDLIANLPFTVGCYEFVSFIGQGSYSLAFEVHSKKYEGTTFCGKATPTSEEFVDADGNVSDMELYALTLLDHPNIIRMYDYFVVDGYLFLILEYCQGGTLHDKVELHEPIDLYKYIEGITNALKICHEQSIAHRDIKPENIFIDEYNRPKLADFGLSSFITNSRVNTACGSYGYVPPEVFQGTEYDPYKADIWSLGATFYFMLTGRLPFDANDNKRDVFNLRFPLDADPHLGMMISQMLTTDPAVRPSVFQLMRNDYFRHSRKGHSHQLQKSRKIQCFKSSSDIPNMMNEAKQSDSTTNCLAMSLYEGVLTTAAKRVVFPSKSSIEKTKSTRRILISQSQPF